MIDLFGPGYDAAEAMGILPRVRELGYQVARASYRDETGRRRAEMSFDQFARAVDSQLVSIVRPDLERALREQVPDQVEIRFATSIARVDNQAEGVSATLTDGDRIEADLLVGADGIHSVIRGLVFGDERRYLRYLGFHTAACLFDDPAVYAQVRDEWCRPTP